MRWSIASTVCPFRTRGSVSRTVARGPAAYPPINEYLSTVWESSRFCFQRDDTGFVQKPLGLSHGARLWGYQAILREL